MLVFSDALRTGRAQLLAAAIDEGSAGATTLKIYTGPRPAPGRPSPPRCYWWRCSSPTPAPRA